MTAGTVSSSTPVGADLDLSVDYVVDGKTRSVKGTVDAAAFAWQGKSIWVCFEVNDPGRASLRLPYDPWCNGR